ncbi:MAG: hypothetical protein ACREXX_01360 [Gammaproteobacteria bacterium]
MVNLAMLAPDIVAVILDETLPPDLTLFELAVNPPGPWVAAGGIGTTLTRQLCPTL